VSNTQTAQALSNKALTAQVHYRSQARPCGTCSGQSGSGTDLSLSVQFPLLTSFHQFSIPSHPSLTINHTHTHTHTQKQREQKGSLSADKWEHEETNTVTHRIRIHQFTTNDQSHAWSSRCLQFITVLFYTLGFSLWWGFHMQLSWGFQAFVFSRQLIFELWCWSLLWQCNKTLSQYSAHQTQDAKTRMSTFIWW